MTEFKAEMEFTLAEVTTLVEALRREADYRTAKAQTNRFRREATDLLDRALRARESLWDAEDNNA